MFGNRCRHDWIEVKRMYNPPTVDSFKGRGSEAISTAEKLLNGFTNIEQECSLCGKIDVISFTGKI